jgi:CheY-like chemotaxis protein
MRHAKRVLIIDDELDIREVAKVSLEITQQWEVLTAASGPEGMNLALQHQPDAILLDVLMPDVDGLATLKTLRAHPMTQAIPVILLTATTQLTERKTYLNLGVRGILLKPFDPGLLGQQIATVLGWPAL